MKNKSKFYSSLDLRHYSTHKIELENRSYTQSKSHAFKPEGFWVSVGDAWEEWCNQEDFRVGGLTNISYYKVNPENNILFLKTKEDMISFNREFRDYSNSFRMINWYSVSKNYDGIIITRYFDDLRLDMDFSWYYSWDIASGCIWNTNSILRIS